MFISGYRYTKYSTERSSETRINTKGDKADCKKIYKITGYGQPEGSVTIEAAVIIPILVMFLYLIAGIGLFTVGLEKKYSDTTELARKASVAAYLAKEHDGSVIVMPGIDAFKGEFLGIKLQKTALYHVSAKPFIGMSLKDIGGTGSDDEDSMVFITENATVFHKDSNCTHLKLSIHQTFLSNVPELRNLDGGKYKPCEKCGKKGFGEVVIITKEGDRYHSDISCSGLKRTVRSVTQQEARSMGLSPCSRCGR